MKTAKRKWIGTSVCLVVVFVLIYATLVYAAPSGPTVVWNTSSWRNTSGATSRSDDGGHIVTLNLSLDQQTFNWKAYVGNITGKITLDDANSFTIYDWALTTIEGEIYATRNTSVTWTGVECANGSIVDAEMTNLNTTQTDIYSINNTFNWTVHDSFIVSGINISLSSCPSTATYVNDTAQDIDGEGVAVNFQEVLLQQDRKLIYATILEQNAISYIGNTSSTYDFQMIVGEAESASNPLTYYFYGELG